jgi:protein required for attachment to host cells
MDANWIVAANAGRARFFALAKADARMEEINDMVNPSARQRESDIETDSLGQRAAGDSRHNVGIGPTTGNAYQPHQTPKQHEAELFARDVARYLLDAHNEGRFRRLSIVASPEFLGVLRREMDPQLAKVVDAEIDKDYTHAGGAELRERLQRHREKPGN